MTLLLAARARNHILLTADGRCSVTNGGERRSTSDTLQKIFPVDNRSIAVVHHGENILSGQPISQVVATLLRNHADAFRTAGVRELSLLIADSLDRVVSATLTRIRNSKNCGFWICGVEDVLRKPQMYEVIWQKESPAEITLRINPHGDLLIGGDGAQFIKKFLQEPLTERLSWDRLFAGDLEYSLELHDELYRRANDAQKHSGMDVFGGHRHQLAVTVSGCQWIIPPDGTYADATEQLAGPFSNGGAPPPR